MINERIIEKKYIDDRLNNLGNDLIFNFKNDIDKKINDKVPINITIPENDELQILSNKSWCNIDDIINKTYQNNNKCSKDILESLKKKDFNKKDYLKRFLKLNIYSYLLKNRNKCINK
jgi:hypothetical protein